MHVRIDLQLARFGQFKDIRGLEHSPPRLQSHNPFQLRQNYKLDNRKKHCKLLDTLQRLENEHIEIQLWKPTSETRPTTSKRNFENWTATFNINVDADPVICETWTCLLE